MFQALLGLYEVSHVHLSWCVSIETKGLTLGSLGRRKIIQLKMYMAVSGRAAERGLLAQRRLPAPTLVPCLPRKLELEVYLHSLEQEKGPPLSILGCLQSLTKGSVEWSVAASLEPEVFLSPATTSLVPSVWGEGEGRTSRLPAPPPTCFVTVPAGTLPLVLW